MVRPSAPPSVEDMHNFSPTYPALSNMQLFQLRSRRQRVFGLLPLALMVSRQGLFCNIAVWFLKVWPSHPHYFHLYLNLTGLVGSLPEVRVVDFVNPLHSQLFPQPRYGSLLVRFCSFVTFLLPWQPILNMCVEQTNFGGFVDYPGLLHVSRKLMFKYALAEQILVFTIGMKRIKGTPWTMRFNNINSCTQGCLSTISSMQYMTAPQQSSLASGWTPTTFSVKGLLLLLMMMIYREHVVWWNSTGEWGILRQWRILYYMFVSLEVSLYIHLELCKRRPRLTRLH